MYNSQNQQTKSWILEKDGLLAILIEGHEFV